MVEKKDKKKIRNYVKGLLIANLETYNSDMEELEKLEQWLPILTRRVKKKKKIICFPN